VFRSCDPIGHIRNKGCGTEKSYFFFTLFVELEEERETDDREGEERVTRAVDELADGREEEDMILEEDRLGAE
jgi:hypothetical protein